MQGKEASSKRALVIGISNYDRLKQLPACNEDADAPDQLLKRNKYDHTKLVDPNMLNN
jgi:Caspase domain